MERKRREDMIGLSKLTNRIRKYVIPYMGQNLTLQ